ncbi:MAG: methionine adenosyltransferase [Clostridia bacterium]|nr:methionine adenosyltransferase [Clostridia bacterium]
MNKHFFTSESVTEGHPDKICDQISDTILDNILAQDPMARVACETCVTTDMILIMGEVTTTAAFDAEKIAREVVRGIGYDRPGEGFDADTCRVIVELGKQSPDISMGVTHAWEQKNGATDEKFSTGAGDQGLIFGFACSETPTKMPLPVFLAHKLAKKLTQVRKTGVLPYLRPDGKTQVTVEYHDGMPARVEAIVVSSQHTENVGMDQIRRDLYEQVIYAVVPRELMDENTKIFINPTGRFVIGGPHGDSGLTGRKIIVDTYGGYSRHGGGAFSGKDATKVDRSAAYFARYIAKNIVAAGAADKCEVQLAYAIGVAKPVSVLVETFGTARTEEEEIAQAVNELFDMRPDAIIEKLELRRPIYRNVAAYGHMGREELGVKWEETDMVDALRARLGL